MPVRPGFDQRRDTWSRDATTQFFPGIVHEVFGDATITYAWDAGIDRLDKHYGVDAIVTTPERNIAVAIRVRSLSVYDKYWDITLRHRSLQTLSKRLETQKSIARFMTYFWVNAECPHEQPTAVLGSFTIHLQLLVDQWLRGELPFQEKHNKDVSSTLVGFSIQDLWERHLIFAYCDQKWIPPMTTSPAVQISEGNAIESAQAFFERRFNYIDDHLEQMDQRLEYMDHKVDTLGGWIAFVGKLLDDVKSRFSLKRTAHQPSLPKTPTLWNEDHE